MATATRKRAGTTQTRGRPSAKALDELDVGLEPEADGETQAPDDDAAPQPDPEASEEVVDGEVVDEADEADEEDGPLLDLSTIPERPFINVDDQPYDLAIRGDFSVEDQYLLTSYGRRFDALYKRNNLNPKERKALKTLLDWMFDRVGMHMPAEIRAKLNPEQQSQVVLAFTYAPVAKAAALLQAADKKAEKARASSTSES